MGTGGGGESGGRPPKSVRESGEETEGVGGREGGRRGFSGLRLRRPKVPNGTVVPEQGAGGPPPDSWAGRSGYSPKVNDTVGNVRTRETKVFPSPRLTHLPTVSLVPWRS